MVGVGILNLLEAAGRALSGQTTDKGFSEALVSNVSMRLLKNNGKIIYLFIYLGGGWRKK